jgi:WD40 repeat protein
LSFSPNSRTLASASADTTILLWDVAALGGSLAPKPDARDNADRK